MKDLIFGKENRIMKKIKAFFDNLEEPIVMSRGTWFYQMLAGILAGVILGILIAPPRKMRIGCDNGNNNVDSGFCKCNDKCDNDCEDNDKDEEE